MMFLIFLLLVNVIFDTTTARSLLSRRKPLWVGPVDIDQEISPAQLGNGQSGKPYLGRIHWKRSWPSKSGSCICCHRFSTDSGVYCDQTCQYRQCGSSSGCTGTPICGGKCQGTSGAHHYCECWAPTPSPTPYPTPNPTPSPTHAPTNAPTNAPTTSPSSSAPTASPTANPTTSPTHAPTSSPTHSPSFSPSVSPSHAPTHSPTRSPTTPAPTPLPTTPSPTTPVPTRHVCACDFTTNSVCQFGDNTTKWPHEGFCSISVSSGGGDPIFPSCNCDVCGSGDEKQCFGAPEPLQPDEVETLWEKETTIFCFGVRTDWGCGDFMIAIWLAFLALFVVEFIFIPIHAARESCVHRTPYWEALKDAWLHQCWFFARCTRVCAGKTTQQGKGGLSDHLLQGVHVSEAEMTAPRKMVGDLIRDASVSDIEAMLTYVHSRRASAASASPQTLVNNDVAQPPAPAPRAEATQVSPEHIEPIDV